MTPVVALCGYSGSGKTTLVCGILPLLVERGLKVGTLKRDAHGWELPERDAERHFHSGAHTTMLLSPSGTMTLERDPPGLAEVVERLDSCDLVLAEGFKRGPFPGLWLGDPADARGDLPEREWLGWILPDQPTVETWREELPEPCFHRDDLPGIVAFLAAWAGSAAGH